MGKEVGSVDRWMNGWIRGRIGGLIYICSDLERRSIDQ